MLWKELFSRHCQPLLLGKSAARRARQLGHVLVLIALEKPGHYPTARSRAGFGVRLVRRRYALCGPCLESAKPGSGSSVFQGKVECQAKRLGLWHHRKALMSY